MHRLLDSVLMQDYPYVEMFCIDDGSTDNTKEVVEKYISKFNAKGYALTYVFQENGGQSSAINNGLKLISGEYLCWPDSDDFYNSTETISTFVNTFKRLDSSYAFVRCLPRYISETDLSVMNETSMNHKLSEENQFINCLYSDGFIWPPVNYMIKTTLFDEVNPLREIYVEKNAGQNWQMLLPLLYSYKCYTIDGHFSSVLIRQSSHSRGQFQTYPKLLAKFSSYRKTILSTLDRIELIPEDERESYKKQIIIKYKFQELQLALQFKDKKSIDSIKMELQLLGTRLLHIKLIYWHIKNSIFAIFLRRIKNNIFL